MGGFKKPAAGFFSKKVAEYKVQNGIPVLNEKNEYCRRFPIASRGRNYQVCLLRMIRL